MVCDSYGLAKGCLSYWNSCYMICGLNRKLKKKNILFHYPGCLCPVKIPLSQSDINNININVSWSCTLGSCHFQITAQSTSVSKAKNQRLSLCILRLATETVRSDWKIEKPKRAINNTFTVIQTDKYTMEKITTWMNDWDSWLFFMIMECTP